MVTLAQGEVSVVSSKGQALPLAPGQPLLQGERVLTSAGRVALQWEAGTGLLLGEQSEAELARLRVLEQQVNLWRGRVMVAVGPRRQGQQFSVVAAGVRARVMGTFFEVALDDDQVEIEVYEGKVRVESVRGPLPLAGGAGRHGGAGAASRSRPAARAGRGRRAGRRSRMLNLVAWPSFQRVMAGTGLLALESSPAGAEVVFDARALGTTNLTLRGGLGRHLVELWRGGKLSASSGSRSSSRRAGWPSRSARLGRGPRSDCPRTSRKCSARGRCRSGPATSGA